VIKRIVRQRRGESFEDAKARAADVAAATDLRTMVTARVHVALGHADSPRGYYDPDGTYVSWEKSS